MRRLRTVLARLAAWFGKAERERGWDAEFDSHLGLHIDDNLRAGMSATEARRNALAQLGRAVAQTLGNLEAPASARGLGCGSALYNSLGLRAHR